MEATGADVTVNAHDWSEMMVRTVTGINLLQVHSPHIEEHSYYAFINQNVVIHLQVDNMFSLYMFYKFYNLYFS